MPLCVVYVTLLLAHVLGDGNTVNVGVGSGYTVTIAVKSLPLHDPNLGVTV